MDRFLFQNRHIAVALASLSFWIAFAFLWGVWGWNDAKIGSKWWYFDLLGHGLFGFIGGLNAMFVVRTFGIEKIRWHRLIAGGYGHQGSWAFTIIIVFAIGWEGWESLHDYIHRGETGHIPAQSSGLDTSADLIITLACNIPATLLYFKIAEYFRSNYADIGLQEALLESEAHEAMFAEHYREQNKEVRRCIRKKYKGRLRRFFRHHAPVR